MQCISVPFWEPLINDPPVQKVIGNRILLTTMCSFADPNPELDVLEANRRFMEHSEELYDALIECHWQPLEHTTEQVLETTTSLPEPMYC